MKNTMVCRVNAKCGIQINKDELDSVIENIILNQPVPIGTGLPGLMVEVTGSLSDKKPRKDKGVEYITRGTRDTSTHVKEPIEE